MKISIALKDLSVIITETDKSFNDLSQELLNDYIVTNDSVLKSSEIVLIQKLENTKLDLKSISTEDLVNAMIGRKITHSEMYHIQKLLSPSVLCGNGIKKIP